jgi:hypothetical protein
MLPGLSNLADLAHEYNSLMSQLQTLQTRMRSLSELSHDFQALMAIPASIPVLEADVGNCFETAKARASSLICQLVLVCISSSAVATMLVLCIHVAQTDRDRRSKFLLASAILLVFLVGGLWLWQEFCLKPLLTTPLTCSAASRRLDRIVQSFP